MNGQGTRWLRLAALVVAVTAAALVIWQKHLLAHPAPGLILVLAAALPFLVGARLEDEVLSASLPAGASGFQLKDAPGTELLKAVKTVAEGGSYLDLAVTARVLSAFRAQPRPALRPPDASLTPRELEVLRLVGKGLANGEIARELYISEVTVKAHLGHVLTKLGLRDRAAAIVYAFDTGVVAPGG